MHLSCSHSWHVTPKEAIVIQNDLRSKILMEDNFEQINFVAGVDVGFEDDGKVTRAAIAVLEYPSLKLHEVSVERCKTSFPYVPGLLSFRELPAVLKAMEKLRCLPDMLLCDGQGYAHPRRFGIACHLGLLTDLPAIGVGKTRLLGTHDVVANERGAWQPLMDGDEMIGAVLRTRPSVKPIYISTGHRISVQSAINLVMQCTTRFRLPETTRQAHKFASVA